MSAEHLPSTPLAVLDTNVVLDCLLFRDRACDPLLAALASGELHWIATVAMRAELAHVLARGALDAWRPDLPALWQAWDRHCTLVAPPPAGGPPGRLHCTDPDDQKFIDLAVSREALWLLSHDRAVLKLAPALRRAGVAALTPAAWARARAAERPST